MKNEQNNYYSVGIEYSAALEMFQSEKVVRLEIVNQVANALLRDATASGVSQDDEYENPSYVFSVRKKLYELASLFLDESLCYEGNSDSFHNLAVDYASQNMFSEACNILERGIALIPSSVDLLADYLLYGSHIPEKRSRCKYYFERLKTISRVHWNWRAYSFSIRYLLNELNYIASADEDEQIKNEAVFIGKEYVKKYGGKASSHEYIDRAFSDLADVYISYGAYSKAYGALKDCIEKYKKTPITSFYLAEKEFDDGNYISASDYLTKCISSMEIRPSVNKGYAFLLRAYSDVSLLLAHNSSLESSLITLEQKRKLLSRVRNDLDTARELMVDRRYDSAIESLWTIIEKQFSMNEETHDEEW